MEPTPLSFQNILTLHFTVAQGTLISADGSTESCSGPEALAYFAEIGVQGFKMVVLDEQPYTDGTLLKRILGIIPVYPTASILPIPPNILLPMFPGRLLFYGCDYDEEDNSEAWTSVSFTDINTAVIRFLDRFRIACPTVYATLPAPVPLPNAVPQPLLPELHARTELNRTIAQGCFIETTGEARPLTEPEAVRTLVDRQLYHLCRVDLMLVRNPTRHVHVTALTWFGHPEDSPDTPVLKNNFLQMFKGPVYVYKWTHAPDATDCTYLNLTLDELCSTCHRYVDLLTHTDQRPYVLGEIFSSSPF